MKAIDVSQWQGSIDWQAVRNSGVEIALLKMSGGDAGLYTDSKANANYYGAKAAGIAIGGYHFAGGGNPENEADFFIAAMSPLEQNDVLVLDWEIQHPTPVDWCKRFIQRVIDRTGTRPLIYMNNYTENSLDWSPVVAQNVGLWLANYSITPAQNATLKHFPTYVMHQYSSSGSVPGIAGRVDMNEWFGTTDQFKKYGYQPAAPAPAPAPAPQPTPPPAPVPEPTPAPAPATVPPAPTVDYGQENNTLLKQILAIVQAIANKINGIFK